MIYLLNSPVLTAYGQWAYTGPHTPGELLPRLAPGYQSAIGHPGWLSEQLGQPVICERRSIAMQPGDAALVMRFTQRQPPSAELDDRALSQHPPELGWLERLG